ncbi:hypothetical protein [Larkinella sp. C7]|uniref:hypothetical protein n=1 Tax=Larkinella sp. C7 TaxID=2576607 RepID=UPI0011113021|nr:hypothetical protein [Larkinella sp. C7]
MIKEKVAQRLVTVRKHLGNRLGEDLTAKEVAHQCGLADYTLNRLEDKLRGSTESLVILLRYYRKHGYNQDWILEDDNQSTPMIIPPGRDLMAISQTLTEIEECVGAKKNQLTVQLRKLGLHSSDESRVSTEELIVPDSSPL